MVAHRIRYTALFAITGLLAAARIGELRGADDEGWTSYGHDPGGSRFSPLTQITTDNVKRLQVAWVFHTATSRPEKATRPAAGSNPLRS